MRTATGQSHSWHGCAPAAATAVPQSRYQPHMSFHASKGLHEVTCLVCGTPYMAASMSLRSTWYAMSSSATTNFQTQRTCSSAAKSGNKRIDLHSVLFLSHQGDKPSRSVSKSGVHATSAGLIFMPNIPNHANNFLAKRS